MSKTSRKFSLIEIMVTVAILVIIIMISTKFFSKAQSTYNTALNSSELADNSRFLFAIVTEDLQSAIARKHPSPSVRFYQPDNHNLWFVTISDPSDEATSRMMEVGYKFDAEKFEFQRAFVDDSCEQWNIGGGRDDASDQNGYEPVVEGVLDLTFTCYQVNMQPYLPGVVETAEATEEDATEEDATETAAVELGDTSLPHMVSIEVTLMDSKNLALWKTMSAEQKKELELKTARTFKKSIFLDARGSSE